ncbi:MAG TPA: 4-hydroxy-tetrahydrodipicolinate reductase [Thermoleophilia bacterium]|nr:4-hydroxy-tetrahydrodipicolinate reductase [Thermoleophilia bacterium]
MIDVLVNGAKGKMGALVATTLAAQDDLRPVALVDPGFSRGESVVLPGAGDVLTFTTLPDALAATTPLVGVDFTVPGAAFDNVTQLLSAKVHTVVGTSGLDESHIDLLASIAASNHVNLFVGPNFALGAVLLMRFAQQAATLYDTAEVIELHHVDKIDAPSSTALRTARLIEKARRGARGAAPAPADDDAPSRGLAVGSVHVHSVRLRGLVAHQEVLFGGRGEVLTVRHDSITRESFMPGVLVAVRAVPGLGGTVVGLEHLLGD